MPRVAFSLALIAIAGWMIFKGVQFFRYGALEWTIERARSASPPQDAETATDVEAEGAERRQWVSQWRDVEGLRDKARLLYFGIGQRQLAEPSADGIVELVAAIRVDPIRATSWMDLAQMTWPALALHPLSWGAWEMSGLTGPYEPADLRRRVQFLAQRWTFAEPAQKQRFVFEVGVARRSGTLTGRLRRTMNALPAHQRQQVLKELAAPPRP